MKILMSISIIALALGCNKMKEKVAQVTETKPADPKEALTQAIEEKDFAAAVKTFEITKKGEDALQGNLRLTGLIKDLKCDESALEVEKNLKSAMEARLTENKTELEGTTDMDARNVIESNITTNQMRIGILDMMIGKCEKKLGVAAAEEAAGETPNAEENNTESAAEEKTEETI